MELLRENYSNLDIEESDGILNIEFNNILKVLKDFESRFIKNHSHNSNKMFTEITSAWEC